MFKSEKPSSGSEGMGSRRGFLRMLLAGGVVTSVETAAAPARAALDLLAHLHDTELAEGGNSYEAIDDTYNQPDLFFCHPVTGRQLDALNYSPSTVIEMIKHLETRLQSLVTTAEGREHQLITLAEMADTYEVLEPETAKKYRRAHGEIQSVNQVGMPEWSRLLAQVRGLKKAVAKVVAMELKAGKKLKRCSDWDKDFDESRDDVLLAEHKEAWPASNSDVREDLPEDLMPARYTCGDVFDEENYAGQTSSIRVYEYARGVENYIRQHLEAAVNRKRAYIRLQARIRWMNKGSADDKKAVKPLQIIVKKEAPLNEKILKAWEALLKQTQAIREDIGRTAEAQIFRARVAHLCKEVEPKFEEVPAGGSGGAGGAAGDVSGGSSPKGGDTAPAKGTGDDEAAGSGDAGGGGDDHSLETPPHWTDEGERWRRLPSDPR